MLREIPTFLYQRLVNQYGEELTKKIVLGYSEKRVVTLRINTIKTNKDFIEEELKKSGIIFKEVNFYNDALIIENANESNISSLKIYEDGYIYMQSLSSMLPAIILSPKPNENILDMTAAPGGKTTQISALSGNLALVTACEKNKIRADRLKYNVEKQGANKVNIMITDARKLSNYFSFDKVLLDAPCSGSGTISVYDENLEKYFTEELITRSAKTQYDLLQKAVSVLKPGHEMIYSTCSILEEENENNIRKILSSNNVEIVPINIESLGEIPLLPTKIEGTLCVCPNNLFEGFFVAKLKKK